MLGTLPGMVAGAVIRAELLSGTEAFLIVIAAVLVPLGAWLAFAAPAAPAAAPDRDRRRLIVVLALAVGSGRRHLRDRRRLDPRRRSWSASATRVLEVAPAALAATFLTSIAGVATFALLSLGGSGDLAPDWTLGIAIGLGGLAGAYLGARLQSRLPEALLRRGLGLLALGLGLRYAIQAIG